MTTKLERDGYRFEDCTFPDEALDVRVNGWVLDWMPLLTDEQHERGDVTFEEVVEMFVADPGRDEHVIKPGHHLWDDEYEALRLRDWLDNRGDPGDDGETSP